jgi:signal peptidase I
VALLRIPKTFLGFVLSLLVIFATAIGASWNAMYGFIKAGERRPPRIMFLLPLIAAFAATSYETGIASRITGLRIFNVPSAAMQPTVMRGDSIMTDLQAYAHSDPERGDVVILRGVDGTWFIKRVIGIPGDVIAGTNGVISINGKAVSEVYIQFSNDENAYGRTFDPAEVPPERYFLLGDSRDIALDSRDRQFGMITRDHIKGRVLYILASHVSQRTGQPVLSVHPTPLAGGPAP